MEIINFTKEERNAIAEYIHSFKQDILIKSDAIKLVDVLNNHNLIEGVAGWKKDIENNSPDISEALCMLIYEGVSLKQMKGILAEYYKN
ncbi:MAG: hypothetical protein AABY22_24780 [Nanoarchaeota archaeon]